MAQVHSATALRGTTINIRVQPRQRDLIDHAAEVLGKTRSDFMLETACRAAEDVLLDRRLFAVDAETYAAFLDRLDQPPQANPKLQALLSAKAPWEA